MTAHKAIPLALSRAAETNACVVYGEWLRTKGITPGANLDAYDALWCVPATPYESTDGALRGIRFARERGIPFLGTCGGFQHAMIEYAHNVWGMTDAAHAETDPDARNQVIVPLARSMVDVPVPVRLVPGTRLAAIYGIDYAEESYDCNYGLSARTAERLADGPMRVSAYDDRDDVQAVELNGHPFFIATQFQPERRALMEAPNMLVDAFVAAAVVDARNRTTIDQRMDSVAPRSWLDSSRSLF